MSSAPAWAVDPAWPAVPPCDDDEDEHAPGGALLEPPPRQADLFEADHAAMAARVAELHVQGVRLQLRLHQAQRALRSHPGPVRPASSSTTSAHAARPRGRPTPTERNDRLLALFEQTSPQAAHLQRCRLAARRYAAEVATAAGLAPEAARVLPVTTARDAIAEARRRRTGG